jgi:hypothetical protein
VTDKKKTRDQAELELATMRQCRRLIMRLAPDARGRAVAYLASATKDSEQVPAPPDPRQPELFT